MEIGAVIERVWEVAAISTDPTAARDALESAVAASAHLKAWLAAADARLATALAGQVSFPEQTIADCTRESLRDAAKTKERADTLDKVPGFADALGDAAITAAHVDAITTKAKPLTDEQRSEYFDRVANLVDVAAAATVEEFRRRLAQEAKATERDDGMERLERQRRKTSLRVWTDGEGMWRFDGRFDPLTGAKLDAHLEGTLSALFAEQTPETCPADPVLKQQHLRALAFERLVLNGGDVLGRPGRPEMIVVVDSSTSDGAGGPLVDWGIPVEVPARVVAEMAGTADVHTVVVRNGVVVHAPGELDLGRSTRLASRAQRRALRALHPTCAIPGCSVRYSRCKLHHLVWWRNGGRTDLANLIPLCAHHHSKVHDVGWGLKLGPNRELTISFPDGTVRNTGPPSRRAA